MEGGTLKINAAGDGIQAETNVLVTGGDISITSGGGSAMTIGADASAKGIKAIVELTIEGGTFNINSADDALHSNGSVTVNGGGFTMKSADDGIHGDTAVTINGGDINIPTCYEGLESLAITINDGNIHVVSSDDGLNAADGSESGGMGMPGGGGSAGKATFAINGGYVVLDTSGDGLDANGSATMTGGVVIVNGPTRNDNGPLDYDGTFVVTGGFLVAVGSSGMAQAPSATSTQESLSLRYGSTQAAGAMVHIEAQDGTQILTFVSAKTYQSVVVCSAELEAGVTYDVYSGGSSTGSLADGLYTGGTYTAGTLLGSIALS